MGSKMGQKWPFLTHFGVQNDPKNGPFLGPFLDPKSTLFKAKMAYFWVQNGAQNGVKNGPKMGHFGALF